MMLRVVYHKDIAPRSCHVNAVYTRLSEDSKVRKLLLDRYCSMCDPVILKEKCSDYPAEFFVDL